MTLRLALFFTMASAAAGVAQPRNPPPASPAGPANPVQSGDADLAGFDKDLDALFAASGLTAEQAAVRAKTASPAVRRSAAEVEAAFAEAATAELARVPQIGGKLSYVRNSQLDPLSFGTVSIEIPTNNYAASAQLTVPLSEYVVRYPKLIDAANLGVEAAKSSKASAVVKASQEARLSYYEWLRSRLQVVIAQRQLVQVEATHKQMQALADVQRLSKADLLRVESQKAEAERTLDQLTRLSELREEQLRLLIGAQAGEALQIGEDVRVDIDPAPHSLASRQGVSGSTSNAGMSLDGAVQRATSLRLDVRTLEKGIAAKTKQRQAELAGLLPRLSAFAIVDYANPNQRIFPLKEEFNLTWSAGLQLTWTLNEALISDAARRKMAAETDQLRADYETLLRGTRLEILSAHQSVMLALRAMETSQKGLAAAEEGYRVRKALLAAERATAVELVDAETDLTRARIASLNARVDLRVALVQLRHALGEDTGDAAKVQK